MIQADPYMAKYQCILSVLEQTIYCYLEGDLLSSPSNIQACILKPNPSQARTINPNRSQAKIVNTKDASQAQADRQAVAIFLMSW